MAKGRGHCDLLSIRPIIVNMTSQEHLQEISSNLAQMFLMFLSSEHMLASIDLQSTKWFNKPSRPGFLSLSSLFSKPWSATPQLQLKSHRSQLVRITLQLFLISSALCIHPIKCKLGSLMKTIGRFLPKSYLELFTKPSSGEMLIGARPPCLKYQSPDPASAAAVLQMSISTQTYTQISCLWM